MDQERMRQRIAQGRGFIAALDQSGGSTPRALRGYGIADDAWADDAGMFAAIHAMRQRIVTAPSFGCGKVIGAILFERTMDGEADGRPVPELLASRDVVPFLKVDQGLEAAASGVQLMRPMPDLEPLLDRAKAKGVFGTKMRSVIQAADPGGIAAVVAQQFVEGRRILARGMVPIIEPEYDIAAPDRAEGEPVLRDAILAALDDLADGQDVMLKLSIPVEHNAYAALVDHPRVLRVVALSGGYSREDACRALARNRGMIASFSRALLDDLRADMSDAQFDRALSEAIDAIACASVAEDAG